MVLPDVVKAVQASGGSYNPATETVTVTVFSGEADIELKFWALVPEMSYIQGHLGRLYPCFAGDGPISA